MSSPVIGISTYGHITTSQWDFPAVGVPRPYVEAVRRAGGEPLLIPPGVTPPVIIERLDGIVLSGGGDIDPRRYGQQPHRSVERLDGQRDETEIALVRLALEADLPTLAICRGHQILNVALGGTLHQHLDDLDDLIAHTVPAGPGFVAHDVTVTAESLIGRETGVERFSKAAARHHQAIDRLGTGLVAVGWSSDGIIEAVELADKWILSVEWHPEMNAAEDASHQALFDAVVRRAAAVR